MLKKLKKGFTITELVIVIAVIAILAAVLIPTFSNVISKANESAAMQNCRAAISDYGSPSNGLVLSEGKSEGSDYYYLYLNGGIQLLGTGKGLSTVTDPSAGYKADTTYTVTLKAGSVDIWSDQTHEIYVQSTAVAPKILASKPVSINGTYYIAVFLYQPLPASEEGGGLTNYYSTAYVYTGTYFSFDAEDMADTENGFSLNSTFTVTVTEKTATSVNG